MIRRFGAAALFLAGIALATVLAVRAGLDPIGRAFGAVGWLRLAEICAIQMASILVCAAAWFAVAPGSSYLACLFSRWVRDGASNLLGFIPALGEGISARALALFGGASAGAAAAATIVDVGVEAFSQAAYTLIAFAFLFPWLGVGDAPKWILIVFVSLLPLALVVVLTASPRALAFGQALWARVARLMGAKGSSFDLAETVRGIYGRRGRVFASLALHLSAWTTGAFQLWIAGRAVGLHVGFAEGLALHGMICAARSAFFLVPWAAGVQEGGFLLVGAAMRIDPASALALSLVLRARDVLTGVPGVALWYVAEARRRIRGASA